MEAPARWIFNIYILMCRTLENRIFTIKSDTEFETLALDIFRFQAENNPVYGKFLSELECKTELVQSLDDIPFMPVSLFKSHKIKSGNFDAETVFLSSGTGMLQRSSHHIKSLELYKRSLLDGFQMFYGDVRDITIYALLPSYLENGDSSLVYMADQLIKLNKIGKGGFYLNEYAKLLSSLRDSIAAGENVMLLGVTYAMLDITEKVGGDDYSSLILVETGGMKGKRREMIRDEVHGLLKSAFGTPVVHSEYGMTELLSQAWSQGNGIFRTPPWMKVVIRDPLDPGSRLLKGHSGGINIIDLANIYSCSFIETSDLGVLNPDGSFEVTGRFDNSDLRGCNLLV